MKPVLLRPNPLTRVSPVLHLRNRGLPRIPPRKARALPLAARPVLPAPAPLRAPELPQAVLRVRVLLRVRPALPVPQALRVPRLQVRLRVHLQVRLVPRVPQVPQVLRVPLLPQALRAPAALLRPYGPSISRISRGGIKTRPGFCSPRPKPVRPRAMPS